MSLTTERFFSSVNYMQLGGKAFTDLGSVTQFDNLTQGVDSMFNHFTTFTYTDNILDKYDPSSHFVGYYLRKNYASDQANLAAVEETHKNSSKVTPIADQLKVLQGYENIRRSKLQNESANKFISNPSAATIIEWSKTVSAATGLGYQPFAWTDFGYCKYYGKIPNNRMVTLRRYPFPVSDVLKTPGDAPLIPIAQAVTWFGGETENKLSAIGNWTWDMPWKDLEVTQQDIEGNEVLATDLLGLVTGIGGKYGETVGKVLSAAIQTQNAIVDPNKLKETSGMDKKLQDYIRTSYDPTTGPYWNRVYGPVNVIHKSIRRERGIQNSYTNTFTLKFHYQFRSFAGQSPKMVALDLISNFFQLTHNNAQFMGQLARYFPKAGVKFDKTTTELLTDLLISWAMGKQSQTDVLAKIKGIVNSIGGTTKKAADKISSSENPATTLIGDTASVVALSALQKAIPNLISVKSALSDRPVGEWHIVVGNPTNPIFVMGDLICTTTSAKFDEEIGPEDFPTGITFSVTLRQAKPKDKVSFERMFNSGVGPLASTRLKAPSSAQDTFGEENNALYKEAYGTVEGQTTPPPTDVPNALTFTRFRDRVGLAYGYRQHDGKSVTSIKSETGANLVDDSILGIYFQKNMGKQ